MPLIVPIPPNTHIMLETRSAGSVAGSSLNSESTALQIGANPAVCAATIWATVCVVVGDATLPVTLKYQFVFASPVCPFTLFTGTSSALMGVNPSAPTTASLVTLFSERL